MNIRRTPARIVHGADAQEAHGGTGLRVVAPHRNLANGAARDALALAARRRRVDNFGLGLEMLDAIGFIQRIPRMRRAGLALAPGAVAGVNDQRLAIKPVADMSAGASAFHLS